MTNKEFSTLRKQLHYSQTELALIMNKSRATISRWENGEKPIDHLAVLCIGTLPPKPTQKDNDDANRDMGLPEGEDWGNK
jgi:DNA-binding transcriptional regulator YiaG